MWKRILHFLFGKDETPVRRTVWSEGFALPTVKPQKREKIGSDVPRTTTIKLSNGDIIEFD